MPKKEIPKIFQQSKTWADEHKSSKQLTTLNGTPFGSATASLTVGPRGPIVLHDPHLIEVLAQNLQERIPPRVAFAKGTGAKGYFEVTHDISDICRAKVFNGIGKRTPVTCRFATNLADRSVSDTLMRVPRSLSAKFYTEEGNLDILSTNVPVFPVNDPIMVPSFGHAFILNRATMIRDPNNIWDMVTLRHEMLYAHLFLMSDAGMPFSYRHMDTNAVSVFKLVNKKRQFVYCKFVFKTDLGIKNLASDKAQELAGTVPDYYAIDLYEAVATGDHPSWTLYVQIMTQEELENLDFNALDGTKVWPESKFPLRPVGKLVVNENPSNMFAEIEQLALSPANLVPGIEPSPDRLLQGRILAYNMTQRHRLGTNFLQIPINCPLSTVWSYSRDGKMAMNNNFGGAPGYYPNSYNGPEPGRKFLESKYHTEGEVARYDDIGDPYIQPKQLWESFSKEEKQNTVANTVEALENVMDFLVERAVKTMSKIHTEYGQMLQEKLDTKTKCQL